VQCTPARLRNTSACAHLVIGAELKMTWLIQATGRGHFRNMRSKSMCLNFVCALGVLEVLTCSESKVTAAYLSLDCALEGEEPKAPWQAHTPVARCPAPIPVFSTPIARTSPGHCKRAEQYRILHAPPLGFIHLGFKPKAVQGMAAVQ